MKTKTLALKVMVAGTLLVLCGNVTTTLLAGDPSTINAVWTAPPRAARKPNPLPADAKTVAQGKELYIAGCLACHGPLGTGDGPAAATLERNGIRVRPGNLADPKRWEETDGELFWKLSEGNTPMPSWAETLTEDQRWQVIDYIRTLAPKPTSTVTTTKAGGKS